jgi:LL-diaminopimelate aminotransferase
MTQRKDQIQSRRLAELPPYLFVEIDRIRKDYARRGGRVLDLGIGDPDLGAPPELLERLKAALECRDYDRYPQDRGLPRLVDAVAGWAQREHGVPLGRDEILITIGSKEAIAHLPLAVVDPGDVVLVPDPGYPVYNSSAIFAGASPRRMPLLASNGFWPDFSSVEGDAGGRIRLIYLNYPNNPTAAVAGAGRFREAVEFSRGAGSVLVNDAAYSEIVYDGKSQPLFPIAREAGIPYMEFFSFSKTFSITGWRVGFAVGSPDVVAALARTKANIDSGVFSAVQAAIADILEGDYRAITDRIVSVYRERRDILGKGLREAGFECTPPEGTFYFWLPVPGGAGSIDFCAKLLESTGIVSAPGIGFGSRGEGYFRLSLTASTDTIREAGEKLARFM